MPGLIRRLWRVGAALVATVLILLAIAVGLVRLALVQVPEYRDQVETLAGETLGWPVEIEAMDARWGLRGPELRFVNAQVLTQDGERTLVMAATGSMRFELLALLRGRVQPTDVSLAGVALRIERSVERRWRLLGEEGPALADEVTAVRDEVELPRLETLPGGRLRLEDVRVEYEDLHRGLGPWLFRLGELQLELAAGRLSLAATGHLPEDLGSEFALSVELSGQDARGRPSDWSAGLSLAALEFAALGEAIGHRDRMPAAGWVEGQVSAAAVGGELERVAGELQARALGLTRAAQPAEAGADAAFERLGAAFEWRRTAAGWELGLNDLEVHRSDRQWRSRANAVVWERAPAAQRIEARADHLELEDLQPFVPWLPETVRARAEMLQPVGALHGLELHVDLPDDEARRPDVHVEAGFAGLGVAPLERWPGLGNLSGTVSGDLYQGSAQLDCEDLAVILPRLFREPLQLASAALTVEWLRDEAGVHLHAPAFELANEDASVSGAARLSIPPDQRSPELAITAVARDVQVTAGPRYLPVGIMPPQVVEWLDRALLAGHAETARFEFRGPTREFPFRQGEGLFRVEFDLSAAELDFDPGWPNATGLDASIRFENEGLWAAVRRASMLGIAAGPAEVAIPDLRQGMLRVEGEARGSLAAMREFALAAELLEELLGAGLSPAEFAAGEASAVVELDLPLLALATARAQVELDVSGGVLRYGFLGEPLRDIEARINIDNARVTAHDATATVAGWPVTAAVRVAEDHAILLEGHGRLDAAGLASVLRLPIEAWSAGESDWAGWLRFPPPGSSDPLRLEIASLLQGMAIDLPAPFNKAAEEGRSLRLQASFPRAELMDMELEWDDALRIAARVDRSGPEPLLAAVPGAIEGEPPGLVFSGAVPKLDLGAWLAVDFPDGIEAGSLAAGIAGGRLLVGDLSAPLLGLEDALLELSRGADRWSIELSADRASGRVELPFVLYGDAPVVVRFERLWLGQADSQPVQETPAKPPELPPQRLHPARIPALDIQIDELRYDNLRLGSISARVLHDADGIELIGLEGMGDGYIFQAEGRSRFSETVDESRLGVRMRSDNVGAALDYMGFRRSMTAREGRFDAELSWQGGLRSDWLSALEGEASVMIRDGALVGVEPGAGRVFGLLSIQALPRRLALDFKDVFGEGTAFDRISGDFRFAGGHAITENLLMRGPSANIVVVGRSGLVDRDYDQTAVIVADLGRTLPVAGAIVGGPAVGAALFLLSEVLRKPFQTQITYRLTGSWEHPVIERIATGSVPARAAPDEAQPDVPPDEPLADGAPPEDQR